MGDSVVAANDASGRFADTSPRVAWGGSATEWRAPSKGDHASAPITAVRKRHFRRSHQVAFCTISAL
ncbi:hypothetical protein SAMN02990966_06310 [Rhodospirillales bacterium URHD0017]|nr:hypothetical protein SAMN02990966_06310 [Rhodospirillales bacterium URHD0017]